MGEGAPSAGESSVAASTPTRETAGVKDTVAVQCGVPLPNDTCWAPSSTGWLASRTAICAASSTPNPGPVTVSGEPAATPASGVQMTSSCCGSSAPTTTQPLPYFLRCTTVTGTCFFCSTCSVRPSVTSALSPESWVCTTWLTSATPSRLLTHACATPVGSANSGWCPSA